MGWGGGVCLGACRVRWGSPSPERESYHPPLQSGSTDWLTFLRPAQVLGVKLPWRLHVRRCAGLRGPGGRYWPTWSRHCSMTSTLHRYRGGEGGRSSALMLCPCLHASHVSHGGESCTHVSHVSRAMLIFACECACKCVCVCVSVRVCVRVHTRVIVSMCSLRLFYAIVCVWGGAISPLNPLCLCVCVPVCVCASAPARAPACVCVCVGGWGGILTT